MKDGKVQLEVQEPNPANRRDSNAFNSLLLKNTQEELNCRKFVEKALHQEGKLLDLSSAAVQYAMGYYYSQKSKTGIDARKALQYYEAAFFKGHNNATRGIEYCRSILKSNTQNVIITKKLSAVQGDGDANEGQHQSKENYDSPDDQNNKAVKLMSEGAPDKVEGAFDLFKLAAENGGNIQQYNLGVCYWKGIGVNKNEQKAVKKFKLAAEGGYQRAKFTLEILHQTKKGRVTEDNEDFFYDTVDNCGFGHAYFLLASHYCSNSSVDSDDSKEAIRLLELSEKMGHNAAKMMLKGLKLEESVQCEPETTLNSASGNAVKSSALFK